MTTSTFMSNYNFNLYPEEFFQTKEFLEKHCFKEDDKVIKKITGSPCIGEKDKYWSPYYIYSETDNNLYRGIELVSVFWKNYISPQFELSLQDRLETVKVKTPNGEYVYQKGEIIVECLVQVSIPGTKYKDVLNIEHTRNDLGRVVAIRVVNGDILKEKFDFRYHNYESDWKNFEPKNN